MLIPLLLAAAPMNTTAIEAELIKQHGEAQRARVERGVRQVAALWKKEDGDLAVFAKENFLAEPQELERTLARFETNFEALDGHLLEIGREFRRPSDLQVGPLLKVDPLFATYDPTAHMVDDFFETKLAFVALLNFPLSTTEARAVAKDWTRQQWAEARLTGRFSRRVPAAVQQKATAALADADLYISEYNVWMHHVLTEKGERLFPKGKRLLTHWNLRDELKANYAEPNGIEKQRVILKVMERIVTQTIPQGAINNPAYDWNPFTNTVVPAPRETVEPMNGTSPAASLKTPAAPEPATRYAKWLANFRAAKESDPYSPAAKTAIDRAFSLSAEMPEARVRELLTSVLESPLVPRVATEIERRLGRKLEPVDLWYNGFLSRGSILETELDAKTRAKYPNAEAYAKDMPRLLQALAFSPEKAKFLADHIVVDPARGSGHALQAYRRGDFPHLRTRVEKEGMDYKGYNIAVHEMGHNVEQVFSLYSVDRTLLTGVPNAAFTEAIAFVFQAKDLELLGLGKATPEAERLRALSDFWATWEIAGMALLEIEAWHWMYEHPTATPVQARDAVVGIAQRLWNKYYAPVLGGRDLPILGIYSHMINGTLYLFNYPVGHLIQAQIEEQVRKAGQVGPEIERMSKFGCVSPDVWMINASGEPVSAGPLLRAAEAALDKK